MKRCIVFIALLFVAATDLSAGPPRYNGLWKGEGTTWERPLDDGIRRLTRRSQTTFAVECARDTLRCKGEATSVYSVDLDGIKWPVPLPNGSSIEAEVSGSSEKTEFTYPIEGLIVGNQLQLRAVGEEDLNVPNTTFQFVLTGQVNLPGMAGAPAARPSKHVVRIDAKGWSPFQKLPAVIVERASRRYVAKARSTSEGKYLAEWRAEHTAGRRDMDNYAECMEVAAETANDWNDFCRLLTRRTRRSTCWSLADKPQPTKQGWCEAQWGE